MTPEEEFEAFSDDEISIDVPTGSLSDISTGNIDCSSINSCVMSGTDQASPGGSIGTSHKGIVLNVGTPDGFLSDEESVFDKNEKTRSPEAIVNSAPTNRETRLIAKAKPSKDSNVDRNDSITTPRANNVKAKHKPDPKNHTNLKVNGKETIAASDTNNSGLTQESVNKKTNVTSDEIASSKQNTTGLANIKAPMANKGEQDSGHSVNADANTHKHTEPHSKDTSKKEHIDAHTNKGKLNGNTYTNSGKQDGKAHTNGEKGKTSKDKSNVNVKYERENQPVNTSRSGKQAKDKQSNKKSNGCTSVAVMLNADVKSKIAMARKRREMIADIYSSTSSFIDGELALQNLVMRSVLTSESSTNEQIKAHIEAASNSEDEVSDLEDDGEQIEEFCTTDDTNSSDKVDEEGEENETVMRNGSTSDGKSNTRESYQTDSTEHTSSRDINTNDDASDKDSDSDSTTDCSDDSEENSDSSDWEEKEESDDELSNAMEDDRNSPDAGTKHDVNEPDVKIDTEGDNTEENLGIDSNRETHQLSNKGTTLAQIHNATTDKLVVGIEKEHTSLQTHNNIDTRNKSKETIQTPEGVNEPNLDNEKKSTSIETVNVENNYGANEHVSISMVEKDYKGEDESLGEARVVNTDNVRNETSRINVDMEHNSVPIDTLENTTKGDLKEAAKIQNNDNENTEVPADSVCTEKTDDIPITASDKHKKNTTGLTDAEKELNTDNEKKDTAAETFCTNKRDDVPNDISEKDVNDSSEVPKMENTHYAENHPKPSTSTDFYQKSRQCRKIRLNRRQRTHAHVHVSPTHEQSSMRQNSTQLKAFIERCNRPTSAPLIIDKNKANLIKLWNKNRQNNSKRTSAGRPVHFTNGTKDSCVTANKSNNNINLAHVTTENRYLVNSRRTLSYEARSRSCIQNNYANNVTKEVTELINPDIPPTKDALANSNSLQMSQSPLSNYHRIDRTVYEDIKATEPRRLWPPVNGDGRDELNQSLHYELEGITERQVSNNWDNKQLSLRQHYQKNNKTNDSKLSIDRWHPKTSSEGIGHESLREGYHETKLFKPAAQAAFVSSSLSLTTGTGNKVTRPHKHLQTVPTEVNLTEMSLNARKTPENINCHGNVNGSVTKSSECCRNLDPVQKKVFIGDSVRKDNTRSSNRTVKHKVSALITRAKERHTVISRDVTSSALHPETPTLTDTARLHKIRKLLRLPDANNSQCDTNPTGIK